MAKKSKELPFDREALNDQKIVGVELNNEMQKAYIDYAMSVIVSRALPDVRDGLKPVHRRILYNMYEDGLFYEADFRKSATTVGDVLGRYHPHGDASVYDAMVRLGQPFSLRYPLVQGKGNFGSIDGDPPAAYRYTEAKMAKISASMLTDIEKETVDFVPNFDDTRKEPDVLPSRFPNLLVNGSNGIAVGMATNIPPHNLTEAVDAIIAAIDDPMITIEELMQYLPGPDFPTGGVIMGKSGIRQAYTTGRGKIILRAKAEIEEYDNGKQRIIVTEIPYKVNKAQMEKHINDLIRDGKLDGISSTRDESSSDIRLVIDLKRDANANVVLNNLYKYTEMQESFGIILIALVDKVPKLLNLKEVIDYYIAHQEDVIVRRTRYELRKAQERAHLLEGYKVVVDNVDEVIRIIRASKSIADAKEKLSERFGLDEIQATAIVQMQLGRLSGLEIEKIESEYESVIAKISEYEGILADETKVCEIIKNDLIALKNKYGDPRRTEIAMDYSNLEDEDLIEEEECILTLTHNGYTKRMPVDTYRSQNRGGRGITGVTTREEDFVEHLFTCSTHDNILFFTTKGMVYRLKGYHIPESGRTAKGMAIVNLLPLENDEKISAMIPVREFNNGDYLTFVTRGGLVKRTDIMDYARIRQNGLRAIELVDGDELISVNKTDGEQELIIATHNGFAVRFKETDARAMGRTTRGVKAVELREDDRVVSAMVVNPDKDVLAITEGGYGKRTEVSEYRLQSRGGKGIFTYKITEKTGKLAGLVSAGDDEDVMLITSEGVVIRLHVDGISRFGRQTQGVRLVKMKDGVSVVSVALTEKYEEAETVTDESVTDESEE
ncbi:MAG: DNA gyrase subunit A [Clostridiales bacterium]|nr:DNA gyrase subunit A [Clostridiales bacterium]